MIKITSTRSYNQLIASKSDLVRILDKRSLELEDLRTKLATAQRQVLNLTADNGALAEQLVALEVGAEPAGWHINSSKTAAVSDRYKFLPIDGSTPKGVKMTLLTAGDVAITGMYYGETFWRGWAPLPGTN